MDRADWMSEDPFARAPLTFLPSALLLAMKTGVSMTRGVEDDLAPSVVWVLHFSL